MIRWLRLAALLLISSSGWADPAIWQVRGTHANLYLVGTIHLRAQGTSLPANIARIAQRSHALWTEVDMREVDPARMREIVAKHGRLLEGQSLFEWLEPTQSAELMTRATALGISREQLTGMRPWLAALTLQMGHYSRQGLSGASGIDSQLTGLAQSRRTPIHGLETIEEQLSLFAGLDRASELALLNDTLHELDLSDREFDELEAAWLAGDQQRLADYLQAESADHGPWMAALTTERNQRWLVSLQQQLRSGRQDVLVAVGALHLVGEQGLVQLLQRAGYPVHRLP